MKNRETCNLVNKILSNENEIVAIFNNGSSVVGMDIECSDVDFVVIVNNNKGKDKIIKILRNNFKITINEENPEIEVEEQYEILDKRADFTLISQKDIENKVYTFYDSDKTYLELQHFIKHKIVDSIAVYDPNKLLKRYQQEVQKYPQNMLNKVYETSINKIKENLYYFEYHGFRNEFQYAFEQFEILQPICQALYVKNKRLFMLPYKRLHQDLKELRPNIEKEMYELIRGENNPQVINKKIKIIKKILRKLEK